MSFFQKGKVIKRKVSFRTCQIVQITCTMHTLCPFLKRGAAFKKGKKCVCVDLHVIWHTYVSPKSTGNRINSNRKQNLL